MAPKLDEDLLERNRELEARLQEAEETLSAIRTGAVDAFVASGPDGSEVVYTLQGADAGYRLFVEQMAEGALTVAADGLILFVNDQFAKILGLPAEQLIGSYLPRFIASQDRGLLDALLAADNVAKAELYFQRADGTAIPTYLSASRLRRNGSDCLAFVVTDLTEQKRNQKILAAGKLAQTILEQAAVPIVVTDPEGKIIQASKAVEQFLASPVLLRHFDVVFDLLLSGEEGGLSFGRILEMLCRQPNIAGLQAAARTPDGRSLDVLINAAPLNGPRSEVLGYIVVLVDITERKLAEERLRESYQLLNLLLDQSPLAIVETDSAWRITRWTGTAEQIFGWAAQEVLGKRIDEMPFIHPEDLPIVHQAMGDMFSGSRPSSVSVNRNIHKDGWVIDCEWYNSAIYDKSGRLVAALSRVVDVTERKRAEQGLRASHERFRKLHESNVIGIISADSDRIYEANDLFLQMIGNSREDLRHGLIDWRQLTPPEFQAAGDRALRELSETGSFAAFEKEYIRNDGSRVPVLIGGTLLERDTLRHICFVLDLTERKKLESKLQEKDKLESLGLLAGGIAHDFNNLLVGIMGNASLAQEMVPEGSLLARALESIVKSSESAAHLTRQMVAYAGKGQFVLEPVHLPKVIEETLKLLRSSIPPGVVLHLDVDPNVFPIEGDASQMQQVVMNLILNAAEAIADEKGVIVVRTANCTLDRHQLQNDLEDPPIDPGQYVLLEVRDTGCGMDEQTRARIFDPFFTTKFMGRGLGLAAVSGIVRALKAAIRVTSTPGAGSRFTVYFPAAVKATRLTAEPPRERQGIVQGTETVLVVDDESTVLETATLSLQRHGYTVLAASSGHAAIEILKRDPDRISLVLLDVGMPTMTGQDALQELLKIKPELDVLVSSGYSEAEAMRFFSGMRVCGFVQKPYTPIRLARQVAAALASRGSSRLRTA